MKFVLLAVLVIVSANFVWAQDRCGTNAAQLDLFKADPQLEARIAQMYDDARTYAAQNANKKSVLVTIPIVVHVVHNGEAYGTGLNITDEQIYSQIEVLNTDFRKRNADTTNVPSVFKSLAADVEIEFCLAVRDPDGQWTSGITRYDGNRTSYTRADFDALVKPVTTWDRNSYLNVWTTNLGGVDAGVLGYAIKPGNSADIDGVVIRYNNFGTVGTLTSGYDLGRTCVHEIGHWLGLDHTWGLDDPSTNNCGDDDFVNDTPIQNKANYGCPSFPSVSCTNGPDGDMFMNYMDYTDDDCQNMFTLGQKTLMTSVVNTFRPGILTSTGCTVYTNDVGLIEIVHPGDTVCVETFVPIVHFRNEGSVNMTQVYINYTIDGSGFTQQVWRGNLAPNATIYVPIDAITLAPGNYEFEVSLANPNGGNDGNNQNNIKTVNIVVQAGSAVGLGIPYSEGFESSTWPPALWDVSTVNANDWNRTLFAANGSIASAFVNLFNETTTGKVFQLYSPTFQVFGTEYPVVVFDFAYTQIDASSIDTLKLFYSIDCGRTWTQAWSRGGAALATNTYQVNAYIPSIAAEWQQAVVEIQGAPSQNQLRLRFDAKSGGGNNLYLENINIVTYAVGVPDIEFVEALTFYPNPANSLVNIQAKVNSSLPVELSIYNALGEKVFSKNLQPNGAINEQVDITTFANGLYIVSLTDGVNASYKKLLVN